jgi:glycosyltransferase involved in cell wall biosynthesis
MNDSLLATCPTGYAAGGLGQHLAKIREDALAEGLDVDVFCQGGIDTPHIVSGGWEWKLFRWPPFRWRPALRVWWRHEKFDREVASRLVPAHTVTAFMGAALHTFRRAREQGAARLVLEMPNSHPDNLRRQHRLALREHPLESSWMGSAFARKVRRELALADEVRANSDYTAQSAVAAGVDPSKIVRRHLGCDPRFSKVVRIPHPQGLRTIVFVGSLTVFKGIPLLVEAFRSVEGSDLRLLLVGGWTGRGMRRWLQRAQQSDPRVQWTSGDPAPHLATASLAVHPTWEDGWGYAPAEALAARVPLVVSDQTGMKELLVQGGGNVLPAGDSRAWREWLQAWASRTTP